MAERKLTEAQKREIRQTDPQQVSTADLAAKYNVSEPLIQRVRRQGRAERIAAAKEVLEKRVEAEMPNALEALGATLRVSRAQMEAEPTPPWVRETRESATALLKYLGLGQEKDPLDAISDEVLMEQVSERLGLRR